VGFFFLRGDRLPTEPTDPKQQINPIYSPEMGLFIPSSIEEAVAESELPASGLGTLAPQ